MTSPTRESRPLRKRFSAAFARHKTAINVLSAFVVFTSFAVKEGWDQQLREQAAIIGSAESRFDTEQQREADADNYDYLLTVIRSSTGERCGHPALTEARDDREIIDRTLEKIQAKMAEADEFYSALPDDKRLSADFKQATERYTSVQEEVVSFDLETSDEPGPDASDVKSDLRDLLYEVDTLQDNTDRLASKVRDRSEKYHKICAVITYLLFTVGWGSGLITTVVGDHPEKPIGQ
jgi:hypothetical protein